ncbi:MAG: 3-hydroxyacyl-CoA dehydrogenase [Burkholderiaceae bacterium]
MDPNLFPGCQVAVVGAGVMGAGIAQVALLAGHPVRLYDIEDGTAASAARGLALALGRLAGKGKLAPADVESALARLQVADTLGELAGAALVVEAVAEELAVKQRLMRELEAIVAPACVLASNTSSLSITAIARGLESPGRVVGMHFFNPVPRMRLVEVVSGLETEVAVGDAVHSLARAWGKTAVRAKSTPGFIVNRIARPFYAEALALLHQQAAAPGMLDACLRGAGFPMGPCELMDLIGHDVNFAVTRSVYDASFQDKRFQPSPLQREMVEGGLLGRKSGRGFYRYAEGGAGPGERSEGEAIAKAVNGQAPAALAEVPIALSGDGPMADLLAARLTAAGLGFGRDRRQPGTEVGLRIGSGLLMLTDGRCAGQRGAELGLADVALFDRPFGPAAGFADGPPAALAYSVAQQASPAFEALAAAALRALRWSPRRMSDVPGLAVARTIAMLINEASDAVDQGVCDAGGADAAMTLGVNYPAGPFGWLAGWGAPAVVRLLDALDAHHRGERYRVSPRLRRAAWASMAPPAAR